MRDPRSLYELSEQPVPAGLPLVVGLTGFADAGSVVAQTVDYLRGQLAPTLVAAFDVDELLDYRSRRPVIRFEKDRVTEIRQPRLELELMTDDLGRQLLLLSGFEPDLQWRRFAAAVVDLIDRFAIGIVTWINSIPMPVPHTRPVGITVSGSRTDLVEAMSVWQPTTEAPATAVNLIDLQLQERAHETAGFVVLVPHYLADSDYPVAALAALDAISAATGRVFPTDELRERGREFLTKVNEQVAENSELANLLSTLETRHDAFMEDTTVKSPLTDMAGQLPSADELADELERYLQNRPRKGSQPGE